MKRLTLGRQLGVAWMRVRSMRRHAAANVMESRLASWRAAPLGELIVTPQSLRSADPSFWDEIEAGCFGLAGHTVHLNGRSPFAISSGNRAWEEELHGFAWLRHLEASGDPTAFAAARRYVLGWVRHRPRPGPATAPAVRARRILSWISHAPIILDGATEAEFDTVDRGLARELLLLSGTWKNAGEGYPRLLALTALTTAYLAYEEHQSRLDGAARLFATEIERQILQDGGHISRNPGIITELLLDWLPLRACFETRHIHAPDIFEGAVTRMLVMLRYLRLGDGALARFNGGGPADPAAVATLAAYDDGPLPDWGAAPQSRYLRLEAGPAILIADAGSAPPLPASGEAHAGCLSFEVSDGHHLLVVNAGAPCPADAGWRAVSRATASHSTLCLGEQSSARLMRSAGLEAMLGAVPLQGPPTVTVETRNDPSGQAAVMSHDGYFQRFALTHRRELKLAASGGRIEGCDRLETKGQDRLHRDVPFAIHFHLHPSTTVEHRKNDGEEPVLVLRLRNGQAWLFRANGASAGLEESIFLTGSSGPRPSVQIVLRGATDGATLVHWTFERDQP